MFHTRTLSVLCLIFLIQIIPTSEGISISKYEMYRRLLGDTLSSDEIEKGCGNNPADIVFVLDESGSIWGPDFDRQKKFVKSVVRLMDVGKDKTHIGVETFATHVRVQFNLGDLSSKEDTESSIDSITQSRGQTYTYDALKVLYTEMFSKSHSRPGVTHIAIVITDGKSEDSKKTAKQAMEAKNSNITIFAIGVGPYINDAELKSIATSADHVYKVRSYSALEKLKKDLAWKACQVSTVPPPTTTTTTPEPTTTTTTPVPTTTRSPSIKGCRGRWPIDVVFSVSENAGVGETREAFGLLRKMVETIEMGPMQAQVGLAPRSCRSSTDEIKLMEHDSETGFNSHLERLLPRGVDVPTQLHYLSERAFTAEKGGRQDSAKVAVVIVDGPIRDMASAREKMMLARSQGIELVFVGVGDKVRKRQLEMLATDSKHGVIMVDSYDKLPSIKDEIQNQMCTAIINKLYEETQFF